MYSGKNHNLPLSRRSLYRQGWHATVLYLWTRGIAPPVYDRHLVGLPDDIGLREVRLFHPPVRRDESRALVRGTGALVMSGHACEPGGCWLAWDRDDCRRCRPHS
jgi:hypothetical protein